MEWLLLMSALCLANGWIFSKEVCYDSLGCFSTNYPYTNTRTILPRNPDEMGTKFLLVINDDSDRRQEIDFSYHKMKVSCDGFNSSRQTKIIFHGYYHTVDAHWVAGMVEELLIHDKYNIILVDWRIAAGEINYMQSVANIRVVGAELALLLEALQSSCGLQLSDVHIIGHSLGAHTAGYAGDKLKGIARITGLDPAGPLFDGWNPAVRLDPKDAIFVDVIHTDGKHIFNLGFGLKMPLGDVDFYPNGGADQPGCPTTYFAQLQMVLKGKFRLKDNVGCSHLRAIDLFTESINSKCEFRAYPSSDINRKCDGACAVMGFHTPLDTGPGKYFLRTRGTSPFCKRNQRRRVKS